MPIKTEEYRGHEIRIRIMGPPPYTAMIRRPGSGLYESEIDTGDSEAAVRAAAIMHIDRLIDGAQTDTNTR